MENQCEKHEQYEEWVSAYLDGALTEEEQRELQAHIEVCEPCRKLLAQYETLHALSAEDEADALSPELAGRIRAAAAPVRKPRRRYAVIAASAALCVLTVSVLLVGGPHSNGEKTEDPARAADVDLEKSGADAEYSLKEEAGEEVEKNLDENSMEPANGSDRDAPYTFICRGIDAETFHTGFSARYSDVPQPEERDGMLLYPISLAARIVDYLDACGVRYTQEFGAASCELVISFED